MDYSLAHINWPSTNAYLSAYGNVLYCLYDVTGDNHFRYANNSAIKPQGGICFMGTESMYHKLAV